jgi:hypothetical protein
VTNDKDFEDEVSRALDILILKGLVEVTSIDPQTGEFLYQISPQLFEMVPDLKKEGERMFLKMLDVLWIKGFVSMDKTQENPKVTITSLALDKDSVDNLSYEERTALYIIMDAMERQEGE